VAVDNQNDLLLALERGDYGLVLGTAECEQIDFKEAPYQLESPRQKWELAKDVAAFANSRGGVIVFGFRTSRDENHLVDTASEYRPIQKVLIDWSSYRDIISRWVRPGMLGFEARWFPADPSIDRGVFVLTIPAQPEDSKHFLVCEMIGEDGSFPGSVGVPMRNADAVTWMRGEALQSLVREALWWRRQGLNVSGRGQTNERIASVEALVSERCKAIESLARWDETPFIALHAMPEQSIPRPDNFYSGDGLRGRLASPSVLRSDGFNVATNAQVEVQPDGSLSCGTRRKALWLSQDGFLTAAGAARGDFLGWYVNQGREAGQPLALNPRVTAEYVLEFCRFFHRELKTYYTGSWDLWLSIVGFDRSGGVVLVPQLGQALGHDALLMWGDFSYTLQPIVTSADRRLSSRNSSGSDAYRLLVELYALFAAPPDLIPYAENGAISELAIVPRK